MNNTIVIGKTSIITAEPVIHHGENRIKLIFKYDKYLIEKVKKIPSARWSQTMKCWHVPDTNLNRKLFGSSISGRQIEKLKPVPEVTEYIIPQNAIACEKLKQKLLLKAYSEHTIRNYVHEFKKLLLLARNHNIEEITQKQLLSYFLYLVNYKHYSESLLNLAINAIKFYFEEVLHNPKMLFDIPRPKKPYTLPNILATQEVTRILKASEDNLKHQTILMTGYSAGLRVSEIVNLKITDIDSERMVIVVRHAKGKKDRIVMLSEKLLIKLREYYKKYKPGTYLFEGKAGEQYSTRSVQAIFNRARTKAGVHKKVTTHSLRHSFATHLLETGVDIRYIQDLLGHSNIKTTMIYTHVSKNEIGKIKSPFDDLEI